MEESNKQKEMKKKLDDMGVEEIIRAKVKSFGTSAHVIVGKKNEGKNVVILILNKK